jgi:hypothetical protein
MASLNESTTYLENSLISTPNSVRYIRTLLPSFGFFSLVINPFVSIVFKVLDKLVDSTPILGPKAVDGVPLSGSILNKAKPVAMLLPFLFASSLYILVTAIQVDLNI